jgi:hypothetical protein
MIMWPRTLVLAFALLAAAAVEAQEFDVFDPNDFLDPRIRGGAFNDQGPGMSKPGDRFDVIRAYSGRVTDFQWRNQPTGVDLAFLHLTGSIYDGNKQLNLKFTAFDPDQGAQQLPRYRSTAQFGYYFATEGRGAEGDKSPRVSGRLLVSYTFEDAETDGPARQHAHEYGMELDAYRHFGRLPVEGSLVWVRRYAGAGEIADRLSYLYRLPSASILGVSLGASVGAGVEHAETWHAGAMRAVFSAAYDIPLGFTVNASYAPAYIPGLPSRRTYHELAFYVDRTLMAHFSPRAK